MSRRWTWQGWRTAQSSSQLSITSTTPGPGPPLRCGCSKGMENRIQKSASPCLQSGLQAAQLPPTQAGSPHALEQRQPAHRERTKGGFLKTEPLQPPEKRLPKPGTCMLSHFSCVFPCAILRTVASQAPLFMGFSRQGYWSGLPCHPSGDLPDSGIEPASPTSPALAGRFLYH